MSWDGSGWVPDQVQTAPRVDNQVEFFVPGTPVPQGSKTAYVVGRKAIIADSNRDRLKPWRATVAEYAAQAGHRFSGPVRLMAEFVVPMPQRPKWVVPATRPDVDKLLRALCDGLTDGGLIDDDARIVQTVTGKRFGVELGARVRVTGGVVHESIFSMGFVP